MEYFGLPKVLGGSTWSTLSILCMYEMWRGILHICIAHSTSTLGPLRFVTLVRLMSQSACRLCVACFDVYRS